MQETEIIFSFKGHPFTLKAFTLQGTERELSTEISKQTETNVPEEFLSILQEMERKTLKVVPRVNSIQCSGDRMRQLQGHLRQDRIRYLLVLHLVFKEWYARHLGTSLTGWDQYMAYYHNLRLHI